MRREQLSLLVLVFLLALGAAAGTARADVELPAVFADHMVVQRDRPIAVWGTAEAGESVSVRLGRRSARAKADEQGDWRVALEALPAGGPHVLTVEGRNRIQHEDVLVGEVWICSGQSNMSWPVAQARDAASEIAAAEHPTLRLCTIDRTIAPEPRRDVPTRGWVVCAPESVKHFSAVAYYFGRELQRELQVPIGLIHTSWGGTPVEAWTPKPVLAALPEAEAVLQHWQRRVAEWEETGEGKDPLASPHYPSGLFNAMVAPLVPFSFRGAIWYQGESNVGRAWHYRTVFPAMIQAWRTAWDAGDFPFYFVQLANYRERREAPGESAWAELRDAQLHTLEAVPATGMAVTIDIGEAKNIHPKNKQEVGRRLALWALKRDYDRPGPCSGPLLQGWETEGAKAILHFRHVGDGLACPAGEMPKGFAIAGEDRVVVPGHGPDRRGRWRPGGPDHLPPPEGPRAEGRALRVGGQPGGEPPELCRPARLPLPHG